MGRTKWRINTSVRYSDKYSHIRVYSDRALQWSSTLFEMRAIFPFSRMLACCSVQSLGI